MPAGAAIAWNLHPLPLIFLKPQSALEADPELLEIADDNEGEKEAEDGNADDMEVDQKGKENGEGEGESADPPTPTASSGF